MSVSRLLCFVLFVITISGLGAADLVEVMPGQRLAIPADWLPEVTADRRTQVWRHPAEPGVALAVQVQTADDQRDATALLDEALALLTRLGNEFQITQTIAADAQLGPGWQHARYTFRTGPTAWDQDAYMLRSNNRILAITCSMPLGSRQRWQAAFTGIMAGLARTPSRLGD